ncbi:hypothetical protein ACFWIA_30195 [Streptomyces sp. NPDC127068]|uniref:hypothetical protein n=1 Tax=Streptomyces sp. NPDC127068 TaxID=3347127 RepID=UPI0036531169
MTAQSTPIGITILRAPGEPIHRVIKGDAPDMVFLPLLVVQGDTPVPAGTGLMLTEWEALRLVDQLKDVLQRVRVGRLTTVIGPVNRHETEAAGEQ